MSKAWPHAGRAAFLETLMVIFSLGSWPEPFSLLSPVDTVILYFLLSIFYDGDGVLHTVQPWCAGHAIPKDWEACSALGNTVSVDRVGDDRRRVGRDLGSKVN